MSKNYDRQVDPYNLAASTRANQSQSVRPYVRARMRTHTPSREDFRCRFNITQLVVRALINWRNLNGVALNLPPHAPPPHLLSAAVLVASAAMMMKVN